MSPPFEFHSNFLVKINCRKFRLQYSTSLHFYNDAIWFRSITFHFICLFYYRLFLFKRGIWLLFSIVPLSHTTYTTLVVCSCVCVSVRMSKNTAEWKCFQMKFKRTSFLDAWNINTINVKCYYALIFHSKKKRNGAFCGNFCYALHPFQWFYFSAISIISGSSIVIVWKLWNIYLCKVCSVNRTDHTMESDKSTFYV